MTTTVVPTFDEGENVDAPLRRQDLALSGLDADVLSVDDGTDDPPARVAAVAPELRVAVRVERRAEPVGGLRRAVSRASGALSCAVLPGRVREVPFAFGERLARGSHAGAAEGSRVLTPLVALRAATSPTAARALRFAAVGASGVLPNLVSLWLLESADVGYLLAAVLAVQVSIVWNFVGAELVVWRGRTSSQSLRRRLLWFAAFGETDLLRLPFVVLLVEGVHLGTPLATVITLLAAFLLRFLLADRIVYRATPAVADGPGVATLAAESAA